MLSRFHEYELGIVRDGGGDFVLDADQLPVFEVSRRRTPIHYFLSSVKKETILLSPMRPQNAMPPHPTPYPQSATTHTSGFGEEEGVVRIDGAQQKPQVIVSVRLESTQTLHISEWAEWLRRAPASAAELKVEGWYGSFSTLLLLNMPLRVWHVLPGHLAVSFIGYVTTGNLASHDLGMAAGVTNWRSNVQMPFPVAANSFVDSAIEIGSPCSGSFRAPTPPAFLRGRRSARFSFSSQTTGPKSRKGYIDTEHESNENLSESLPDVPEGEATDFRAFACPYRKRRPSIFNVRDWPKCATCLRGRKGVTKITTWEALWMFLFPDDEHIPPHDPEPLVIVETFEVEAILQRALAAKFDEDSLARTENGMEGWKSTFDRLTGSAIQKFSAEAAAMANSGWTRNEIATKRKAYFSKPKTEANDIGGKQSNYPPVLPKPDLGIIYSQHGLAAGPAYGATSFESSGPSKPNPTPLTSRHLPVPVSYVNYHSVSSDRALPVGPGRLATPGLPYYGEILPRQFLGGPPLGPSTRDGSSAAQ
ncbi:hypothetical protein B0T14DRAFT_39686 [Immersiella caudata]|uniref:Uncharacterized protein n=1 Tax=Immersiella caudata TaxID=314043 RepID=A0AA40CC16_9PEZI|nr:hypothetical protein B0T14DRAFT_39686 [Immersiella caudata]